MMSGLRELVDQSQTIVPVSPRSPLLEAEEAKTDTPQSALPSTTPQSQLPNSASSSSLQKQPQKPMDFESAKNELLGLIEDDNTLSETL